jgi:transcriptional regulator NrdR family protein
MSSAGAADAAGIICPACQSVDRDVIESRRLTDRVRRRCTCRTCGTRYTTWELRVIHSDPLASYKAAQLLDKFQDLENAVDAMRQMLEAQLDIDHPIRKPVTPPPGDAP